MAEYIGCRKCDSHDCKGCNLKNLETMLNNGKFDCLMNGNRCINPSADVAPVRHGKWELSKNYVGYCSCSLCSDCYVEPEWVDRLHWRFCPNCGAKMDLEVKNAEE